MANHSPQPDNYTRKKTWAEVMDAVAPAPADDEQITKDTAKRAKEKGAAAKNGGGDE